MSDRQTGAEIGAAVGARHVWFLKSVATRPTNRCLCAQGIKQCSLEIRISGVAIVIEIAKLSTTAQRDIQTRAETVIDSKKGVMRY